MISVIIPSFNGENFIGRCIESVLGQTYRDLEVIVVDDGSTDDTARICKQVASADSRVRLVSQKNQGLSGARNAGIDRASGEYLFFLDCDDYLEQDVLEVLLGALESTGADMAVGGVTQENMDGSVSKLCVESRLVDEYGFWSGYDGMRKVAHLEFVVSWGKLMRRSIFSNERFDLGKVYEDSTILHRLVRLCDRIVFVETTGYHYVRHGASITHNPTHSTYLDLTEGLIARAEYFSQRGWQQFALTSLLLACDSLCRSSAKGFGMPHCGPRFGCLREECLDTANRVFRAGCCKIVPVALVRLSLKLPFLCGCMQASRRFLGAPARMLRRFFARRGVWLFRKKDDACLCCKWPSSEPSVLRM